VKDALVRPDGSITGPLRVAVTGGIGAGKSTVSGLLVGLGARLIDSDLLARQVVEPGTPGLAAVAEAFGPTVIGRDGSLDRAALAALVFADPDARSRLEGITHPLVRAAAQDLTDAAPPQAIVVNDIPILRDVAVAASFHLVVGVGAADQVRLLRLLERGMAEGDARARIAAQISDVDRRPLCDVWLDNSGDPADLAAAVRALWERRLGPFADNRLAGRRAARGELVLVEPDPGWPGLARLLAARISAATGGLAVEHIGSTSIAGLPAKDVIDFQLVVPDLATADRLADALADAGFPLVPALSRDTPHPGRPGPNPGGWEKRLHANADPGQSVNLHVRVRDAPNRRYALLFRDWLRADDAPRQEYLALKRGLADRYATDPTTARYGEAKEPWFATAAPRAEAWAARTRWTLPS
jgi:dephospho-CoA kinase